MADFPVMAEGIHYAAQAPAILFHHREDFARAPQLSYDKSEPTKIDEDEVARDIHALESDLENYEAFVYVKNTE